MMLPKISVIVPVYKVEQYLQQCVDSILAQTYTNLEILLIDDGSPDNCGKICDEYAKKDSRIIVIHKENGGVSSARNAGLDIASGDYINFIDSDDWIDTDMIELLYDNLVKHNADISCCGYYLSYVDLNMPSNNEEKIILVNREQAIKEIFLKKYLNTFLCVKLYKKNLFREIRCPIDMIYCEDSFIILNVFSESKRIVTDTHPKYYYRQRKGSVVHKKHSIKLMDDALKAAEQNYQLIRKKYDKLVEISECNIISSYISILKKVIYCDNYRKLDEYKTIIEVIRKKYKFIIRSKYFGKADKISIIAIKINILLFKFIYGTHQKIGKLNNKMLFE